LRSTSDSPRAPVATRYDVAAGTLRTTDLQGGDAPNPLVSNVVNFKVQYGLDTNGDGALDTWAEATAASGAGDWSSNAVLRATAESLARIKALRVGIIVRGEHFDRAATRPSTGSCSTAKLSTRAPVPGRLPAPSRRARAAAGTTASTRWSCRRAIFYGIPCDAARSHRRCSQSAEGVIVLVALVAILVMALSAAALLRSVDTAVAVAGNLGFMQAAQNAADDAVERAVAALFEQRLVVDPAVDDSANGYFASRQPAESARGVPGCVTGTRELSRRRAGPRCRQRQHGPLRHRAHVPRRRRRNCRQLPPGAHERAPARHAGEAVVEPTLVPVFRQSIRVDGPGNATQFVQVWLADIPGRRRLAWRALADTAIAVARMGGWGVPPAGFSVQAPAGGTPHPPPNWRIRHTNPGTVRVGPMWAPEH
jgi:hypothetical protein